MASKGLNLVSVGFCSYFFEEGTPGEYVYRLELLENLPTHAESVQYINFLEETGVELIGSMVRWVYFRRRADNGGFDLYSDLDSRVKHLNRIIALMLPAFVMCLVVGTNTISMFFDRGIIFGLIGGFLCILVGLLTGAGIVKVLNKRNSLKRERALHE